MKSIDLDLFKISNEETKAILNLANNYPRKNTWINKSDDIVNKIIIDTDIKYLTDYIIKASKKAKLLITKTFVVMIIIHIIRSTTQKRIKYMEVKLNEVTETYRIILR